MNLFLWGALPYIAFTFLIVGTLVRFFYFERNWTTKSSQFLEKKQLRIANPLFHFGLLNDHLYHEGALYMGAVAGIIFIVGFLLLMKRRFTVPAMKVNTSGLDKWLYLFLTLAIFSGMAGTLLNASGFFDYRVSIGPWFRSLLSFMPDPSLMEGVPFMFKFHMLAWMVVAIIFPFSRLVHCLSVPLNYLTRPFIVYRKRDEK
ncbi:MAG: respiratory nitrate reductase subunit gamma [Veillonella sp.]|nr:respiratory nitrate reductase subunit gamma [Veillonella sp.]